MRNDINYKMLDGRDDNVDFLDRILDVQAALLPNEGLYIIWTDFQKSEC